MQIRTQQQHRMSRTLRKNTLSRMSHVRRMAEDFTESCQDKAKTVMRSFDISGSELALNFGHSCIFKGLLSPNSQNDLLNVCYAAFFKLYQDLTILNHGRESFLVNECIGLVNTFHQAHLNHGHSLPALSEDNMEEKLNALMEEFINEDPLFIDMFDGNPPEPLVKAARNYELSFEINLSLNDLEQFLANNDDDE